MIDFNVIVGFFAIVLRLSKYKVTFRLQLYTTSDKMSSLMTIQLTTVQDDVFLTDR